MKIVLIYYSLSPYNEFITDIILGFEAFFKTDTYVLVFCSRFLLSCCVNYYNFLINCFTLKWNCAEPLAFNSLLQDYTERASINFLSIHEAICFPLVDIKLYYNVMRAEICGLTMKHLTTKLSQKKSKLIVI